MNVTNQTPVCVQDSLCSVAKQDSDQKRECYQLYKTLHTPFQSQPVFFEGDCHTRQYIFLGLGVGKQRFESLFLKAFYDFGLLWIFTFFMYINTLFYIYLRINWWYKYVFFSKDLSLLLLLHITHTYQRNYSQTYQSALFHAF